MTDTQTIRQLERQLEDLDNGSNADLHQKIDTLNDLAWALSDADTKRAYSLAEEAYELANATGNGDSSYEVGMAYSLRSLGYLNMRFGDFAQGISQLLRAQELCESLNLDDALADVFDATTGIYIHTGNYPEVLKYVYKHIETAQRIDDQKRIVNAYSNLAAYYYETGDHERSIELFQRNLEIAREFNFSRLECVSVLNLAELYSAAGDFEKVLDFGQSGLKVAQESGFELFEIYAIDHISKAYLKLGDGRRAIRDLNQALALSRNAGAKAVEAMIYISLSEAYRALGEPDSALECLHQAITIDESIDASRKLPRAYALISELYEQQGDLAPALHYFKQYQSAKELIFNEQSDRRVKVLQVVHDTETAKKEAEIAHLRTVELQQEITEHKRVSLHLQHQLEFVRALSAFKETLLTSSESEADSRRILCAALEHLLEPTQAKTISIQQNFDDPEIGLYGQMYAAVANTALLSLETEGTVQKLFEEFKEFLKQQVPALAARPDEFVSLVSPWCIVPDEIVRQLAAGKWVGGSVTELYATTPEYRDFLLQKQKLHSLMIFPIQLAGQWWGTITFSDWGKKPMRVEAARVLPSAEIEQHGLWAEDEILLLDTATEMVASTLQRWQAEVDLHSLNQRLEQQVEDRTAELSKTVDQLEKEITERERAQAEIQQMVELLEQRVTDRSRELAALYQMTILFTEAQDLEETLEPALRNIHSSVDASAIAVHILSADKSELHLAAHVSLSKWEGMQRVKISADFADWLQQAEAPLMLVDNKASYPFLQDLLISAYPTYFGVAMRVRNVVIGLLSVYRQQKRPFSVQNVSLLITMAEQLGIIIQNQRLQEQSSDMIRIMERQRLARELHDSVAQRIYSLNLFAHAGKEAAEDGELDLARLRMQQVEENALFALREMRLLLYQLRPLALEVDTLEAAFEKRFDLVERRLGIESVVHTDSMPSLPDRVEEGLFYIISEALNNALKHAEATKVMLRFSSTDGHFLVTIQDNGRGFDLRQLPSGLGLDSMYSRVEEIDGQVELETVIGQGTTIRITIQLGQPE